MNDERIKAQFELIPFDFFCVGEAQTISHPHNPHSEVTKSERGIRLHSGTGWGVCLLGVEMENGVDGSRGVKKSGSEN